jgi:hypothetical protein
VRTYSVYHARDSHWGASVPRQADVPGPSLRGPAPSPQIFPRNPARSCHRCPRGQLIPARPPSLAIQLCSRPVCLTAPCSRLSTTSMAKSGFGRAGSDIGMCPARPLAVLSLSARLDAVLSGSSVPAGLARCPGRTPRASRNLHCGPCSNLPHPLPLERGHPPFYRQSSGTMPAEISWTAHTLAVSTSA